ncbi:MAG: ribonuclease HII [Dehalococcoidia bacterium]
MAAIPTWAEENRLLQLGHRLIAGVDEVGRGPLAGPVFAAAVILDPHAGHPCYEDLRDSKALSAAQRQRLAPLITQSAVAVGIGATGPEEIDAVGIVQATRSAMAQAVASLSIQPDHLLIDAVPLPEAGIPFRSLIKGDSLCRSIAAASIVAKVARDQHMVREDAAHPGYGFAQHKGYPTSEHLERLAHLGPCPIHRRSFAPVRALISPSPEAVPSVRGRRGRIAEEAAARHMESNGYQVLGRNFHSLWSEIDIVARQGDTLVFVEVKARHHDRMGSAFESVTRRKQERLILTAQEYLQRHNLQENNWRVDVIAIRLGPEDSVVSLEHLENAVMGF